MSDFDPRSAGNLTAHFDASRKIPPAELIEQTRHDYYTTAQMQGNGDPTIGGLTVNTSGRTDMDYPGSDNQKKRERDERMLALMIHNMTLQQIDDQLAARYGENFAENLAAEYLDEESFKRLMSIEDKTERRRQIAVELNQGIRDGSIKAFGTAQSMRIKFLAIPILKAGCMRMIWKINACFRKAGDSVKMIQNQIILIQMMRRDRE